MQEEEEEALKAVTTLRDTPSRCVALALVVPLLLLGSCPAAASGGHGAPRAQAGKKKSCKKKKKKCKKQSGGQAKTPLFVTITSCPTGVHQGSESLTVSGRAAVGPGVVTYVYFNQADSYFDTLVSQEVRVYPSASGAWSYAFTPGFPEGWVVQTSWEERFLAANGRAHDGVSAECSWTVVR